MLVRTSLFLLSLTIAAPAASQPPAKDFPGTVIAVTDKDITVKGTIGDRRFQIYPGTVFGVGNRQKLTDFKPGAYVIVVFSESFGLWKAENVRTAPVPKTGAPKVTSGLVPLKPIPKPESTVGTTHSRK